MEVEVKIIDAFLYTTTSGWQYMLESNYFKKDDIVTDGITEYRITTDGFPYGVPYCSSCSSRWVYGFDKQVEKCEGKILKIVRWRNWHTRCPVSVVPQLITTAI